MCRCATALLICECPMMSAAGSAPAKTVQLSRCPQCLSLYSRIVPVLLIIYTIQFAFNQYQNNTPNSILSNARPCRIMSCNVSICRHGNCTQCLRAACALVSNRSRLPLYTMITEMSTGRHAYVSTLPRRARLSKI